jgi:hypothetical protein
MKRNSHHISGDVTVVLKSLPVFGVIFLETPINGKTTMHRLPYRDYQVRKTKLILNVLILHNSCLINTKPLMLM